VYVLARQFKGRLKFESGEHEADVVAGCAAVANWFGRGVRRLVQTAHEHCYIANSLSSEMTIEPVGETRS
jgi:hypothetical protein